jgi:hypothetical protein
MSNYFSKLPNFNYIDRLPGSHSLNQYVAVKNLFRRPILRSDIFENLVYFTKYQIIGDERPDNVSQTFYGSPDYDWVVLMCNNIINIQTEWPIPQNSFNDYLLLKYENESNIYNGVHHYETTEIKDLNGNTIIPSGVIVPEDFQITFYTNGQYITTTSSSLNKITNYDYEIKKEIEKRNIFLLKPNYISILLEDAERKLTYKSESSQYLDENLKQIVDPRLYS